MKHSKTTEELLSPQQRKIWNNIKKGFEELKMIEEGKLNPKPIQELIDELKED